MKSGRAGIAMHNHTCASTGPVVGILLAAGRSARFGRDKRWHRLADGTPLAVASARNLRRALPECIAVVRADDRALACALRAQGLAVVDCDTVPGGIGASLARGVAASAHAAGWIVALGDMPWIRPRTIIRLARCVARGADIAVPVHARRRGHPVGFSGRYRDELLALDGETGARAILRRDAARVVRLPVDDPGVLRDVDYARDVRATG